MSWQIMDTDVKGRLYAFLSSLFIMEPSKGHVHDLRDIMNILGFPDLKLCRIGELTREYYDLFVVPNPRYVRPYESVYRDRIPIDFVGNPEQGLMPRRRYIRGLLMGRSTMDVLRYYREAGVYPSTDLPDHLGNELAFLSYLLKKAKEVGSESDKFLRLYEKFKKDHPLKWIG
ncbi:MAG: molecular chaperone, partial [Thermodesulfovibrionales bacterium]